MMSSFLKGDTVVVGVCVCERECARVFCCFAGSPCCFVPICLPLFLLSVYLFFSLRLFLFWRWGLCLRSSVVEDLEKVVW